MMKKKTLMKACFSTLLALTVIEPAFCEEENNIPYNELRLFSNIYSEIKNRYVEDISDKELLEMAIDGMLSRLDQHSILLDEDQFKSLKSSSEGRFQGIGIRITTVNDEIEVVSPIKNTPAQREGILAGDIIVEIDGQDSKSVGLEQAIELLDGEPGSLVKLKVKRLNEKKLLDFNIIRSNVVIQSVKTKTLGRGIFYAKINSFQENTQSSLRRYLEEIMLKPELVKGFILDLRGNPGGTLNAAVEVSDLFLTKGKIVSIHGRDPQGNEVFEAKPDDLLKGRSILVLIDKWSASASEIVAGALQDQKRAIIFGEQSYGKGSVQKVFVTGNGSALKLTVSKYHTPSGKSIDSEGIVPNIKWKQSKSHKKTHLDESKLEGNSVPASSQGSSKPNGAGKKVTLENQSIEEFLNNDPELNHALKIISE